MITRAYRLPCKKVIHTIGPVWAGGNKNEIKLLADCYKNSLRIARDYSEYVGPPKNPAFELGPGIRRIAFPSISTGIHGCPLKKAAYTAAHAIKCVFRKRFVLSCRQKNDQLELEAFFCAHA